MAIQHAVLGLLAEGPSYGYELKASFQRAIAQLFFAVPERFDNRRASSR